MNLMKIKELSMAEITEIYNTHYLEDFPQAERKTLEKLTQLINENQYLCLGLFENNVMRAYAFLYKNRELNNMLLDYLSVLSSHRGSGYGSAFLRLLKGGYSDYDGLILEVESVEHASDDDDKKNRERRMSFYFANGLEPTRISSSVKGVVYSIIYFPFMEKWDNEAVFQELNQLYPILFAEKHIDFLKID